MNKKELYVHEFDLNSIKKNRTTSLPAILIIGNDIFEMNNIIKNIIDLFKITNGIIMSQFNNDPLNDILDTTKSKFNQIIHPSTTASTDMDYDIEMLLKYQNFLVDHQKNLPDNKKDHNSYAIIHNQQFPKRISENFEKLFFNGRHHSILSFLTMQYEYKPEYTDLFPFQKNLMMQGSTIFRNTFDYVFIMKPNLNYVVDSSIRYSFKFAFSDVTNYDQFTQLLTHIGKYDDACMVIDNCSKDQHIKYYDINRFNIKQITTRSYLPGILIMSDNKQTIAKLTGLILNEFKLGVGLIIDGHYSNELGRLLGINKAFTYEEYNPEVISKLIKRQHCSLEYNKIHKDKQMDTRAYVIINGHSYNILNNDQQYHELMMNKDMSGLLRIVCMSYSDHLSNNYFGDMFDYIYLFDAPIESTNIGYLYAKEHFIDYKLYENTFKLITSNNSNTCMLIDNVNKRTYRVSI